MLLRNEIFNSRKRLVIREPNRTPKLQKAWILDIIDFFSRFSRFDAYKLHAISKAPKQSPNMKAIIIKISKFFIKAVGNHNNPWNNPEYIRIILQEEFLIIGLAKNIAIIEPIAKVANIKPMPN